MRWLRVLPLVVLLAPFEWAAPGCSNGDNSSSTGTIEDASTPPPTRFEAGTICASSADCEPGLACLYPVSTCNAYKVCVDATWLSEAGACDAPQTACSCLGEFVEVCHGYSLDQVDTTSTCEGGTLVEDAGTDSATAPPMDASIADSASNVDSSLPVDAGTVPDASDAAATD